MNNVQFAKGTIVTVLTKMETSRQKEDSKVYKTLSDSLNEALGIIRRQSRPNEIEPFLILLNDEIKKETDSLTTIANKSIENNNFREHHDWIIAYRKLDSIGDYLYQDAKRAELRNTFPQYKNYNVYDTKGVHMVISVTRSQAVSNIYQKFRFDENDDTIFQSGSDKHKIFNNDRIIHAYGLSDAVRGRKGNVLHIDKSIGFKSYVNLVDDLVNRFEVVNLFN